MTARTVTARVPGRVNLIGEWIDFSGGTVLPMPISQHVTLSRTPNGTAQDIVRSAQFEAAQAYAIDAPADARWPDAIRGALQAARAEGWINGGQTVEVNSEIPVGEGLSSSAATIVAALKASRPATHTDDVALAHLARAVENAFMGVPCGIMDQMAVAVGKPGHALALNTRDCSFELVPIPQDWTFVIVSSGVRRALADGRYKERQRECMAAAAALGVEYLCDSNDKDLARLDDRLARRARHVWSEGGRSRAAVAALKAEDRRGFGALMISSHASLRDDMEVSVPVIDTIVADACRLGADGARITGAGFGGCLVALVGTRQTEDWWHALRALHPGLDRIG